METIIIVVLLLGLIPATIASRKGRSFLLWWLYGSLLFIIVLPIALLIKPKQYIEAIEKPREHTQKNRPDNYVPGWMVLAVFVAFGGFVLFMFMAVNNINYENTKHGAAQRDKIQHPEEHYPVWDVYSFSAELDGHKIWNATTDESKAYGQLTWPSNNITAHITVGKDHGEMYVVFIFSQSPNLVGGKIHDGFSTYKLPISFDGNKTLITITQKWGSPDLYASRPSWFIGKMKSSQDVKIRMPWYQQSAMYFRFDVSGLDDAIKQFK